MRCIHKSDRNIFRFKERSGDGYTHLAEIVLFTHEGYLKETGRRNEQEIRIFMGVDVIDALTGYLQRVKAELLLETIKEETDL